MSRKNWTIVMLTDKAERALGVVNVPAEWGVEEVTRGLSAVRGGEETTAMQRALGSAAFALAALPIDSTPLVDAVGAYLSAMLPIGEAAGDVVDRVAILAEASHRPEEYVAVPLASVKALRDALKALESSAEELQKAAP